MAGHCRVFPNQIRTHFFRSSKLSACDFVRLCRFPLNGTQVAHITLLSPLFLKEAGKLGRWLVNEERVVWYAESAIVKKGGHPSFGSMQW